MKKSLVKVLAIVVALVMLFSLVACEKYPAVSKAFEEAGYAEQKAGIAAIAISAVNGALDKWAQEEGKEESDVELYCWAKGLTYGIVLQFKNTAELKEFYESEDTSATLKGMMTDAQESEIINGNCLIITLSEDMVEIFKNA